MKFLTMKRAILIQAAAYRSRNLADWESVGRVYEGRAEGLWGGTPR